MKLNSTLIIVFFSLLSFNLFGQGLTYGFKAGLNFSTIQGPLEEIDGGQETSKFNTGFHIGAAINYKFVELQGIRFEIMFSQKGQKYQYDGPSFQRYIANDGSNVYATGNRRSIINISNSYLDFPVMWFGRVRPWLEVSAGFNVGFKLGSTGSGELIFLGNSTGNNNEIDNTFKLSYDYNDDTLFDINTLSEVDNFVSMLDNKTVTLPTELDAYYEYDEVRGKYYNGFDAGVNAGISFFLNQGLFVGVRLNYGLIDVTNNDVDYSRTSLDANNNLIFRDDKDRNLSVQTSIGFSF